MGTMKFCTPWSWPSMTSRAKTIAWLAVRPSPPGHHLAAYAKRDKRLVAVMLLPLEAGDSG